MDMGPGATVGAGNYPAKYSFDPTTAKCSTYPNPDFVVYNTSLAGSSTSTAASQTVTFGNNGPATPPSGTVVITNGANTLTLTAITGASSGTNFQVGGDNGIVNRDANANSLVAAINLAGNGSSVGVSASDGGTDVVTITATIAGSAGNSITLTGTINGSNGVAFGGGTFAGGVNAQASIGAFDNLYSGCTGTVPSVYWAYDTGGTVVTSPALSGDGKQIAFVQTVGAVADLVLLKWAESGVATFGGPVTLTTQASAAAYRTCTAPCMYTIAFSGAVGDTTSSPFYDFAADNLYVGDATGHTHKFTAVFNGSPAEAGGPWPVLTATAPLSSPVYDEGTGLVLISAGFQTSNNGGRLHSICASAVCGTIGTTVATGLLGPSTAGGTCQSPGAGATSGDTANLFFDAPIIDPTNKTAYVVIGNDSTGSSAIYEFPETYAANNCGTEIKLGTGSTSSPAVPMFAGTFDNAYYSGGAGHYYACGNTGGDPALYQITVSALGVISGAANASTGLTTATTTCGPVVEVYNPNAGPATDWIFTSVNASAKTTAPISCPTSTGCIMSFNVTSGAAITAATATVGHTAVAGGASGVSVDNTVSSSTLAGSSQIYFTPLTDQACATSGGTGGCAIQASQSAIQ
jgi:hypothetical protein